MSGPGRTPLGPLLDENTAAITVVDVKPLQDALSANIDGFTVTIPADVLTGRLGPFNTRARVILIHLLKGYSRGMAAVQAGVSEDALENWEKRVPEFRAATVWAHQTGFRRVFEPELYRRAMAGSEDRGSMRALELVTKARDSAYRDKSQVQHEIITRAQEQTASLTQGWQSLDSPDD